MGKLYLGTEAVTPILNRGGGGGNEPGGNIKITAYDTTTGVISGGGFGSTPGYVYVLDRDTNTYVPQTVASWTPSSITLSTPVDLTTLEGTTSMAVVADDGTWSNKWLLTGDVAVSGWGKLYVQNSDTRAVYTVAVTSQAVFEALYGESNCYAFRIQIGTNPIYSDEILGFQFGSDFNLTAIGDYFLAGTGNMTQPIVIPSAVTSIGNYFLAYARKFNQPLIIPSSVTSIGSNFLNGCASFNQPLTIPASVTSIGESFLYICVSFNQPLTIPASVTSIGGWFIGYCYSFNQPITLPSSFTSIGDRFMQNCQSFNQSLTIPSSVTSIGGYFLYGCYSFNQPLTIPASVISIGTYFLSTSYSFNQPLTIPASVTSIGGYFLYNCDAFSNLTVNGSVHPTDNNSLSTQHSIAKMYVKGILVKGTRRSDWISSLPNRTSSPYRKLIDGGE